MTKRRMIAFLLITVLLFSIARIANVYSKPAAELGYSNGKLAECPDSPNCVSSQTSDATKLIEPIGYLDSKSDAMTKLISVVKATPGNKVVSQEESYLRIECSSRIFGFIDDMEFLFDDNESKIHFRSASRIGYSDMGKNRARIESIKETFN